jgi:protein SCO1/2
VIAGLLLGAALQALPAPVQRFDPAQDVGIEPRLGERVPADLRLLDEEGGEVRFGELAGGRPLILALVYYECPMLCSLVLDGALRALRPLELDPGTDYVFVAVSIDPREGAELAAAARARLAEGYGGGGGAGGWRALTGAQAELERLAAAVGFRYAYDEASGEYAHAGGLFVLTPELEVSRALYGVEYEPRDLRLALVDAGAGRIGTVGDKLLLLCLRWDPAAGKYTPAILRALQLGGGLTVLLIGAFVGRSLWREARRARRGRGATAGSGG